MEKAYDVQALLKKLKTRGIDVAETAASSLVEEVFDWLGESATISATPYDDLLAPLYPMAKKAVLTEIDKWDGEKG